MLMPYAEATVRQIRALESRNRVLQATLDADSAAAKSREDALTKSIVVLNHTLQASTDILTNTDTSGNQIYTGNPYKTYKGQVAELRSKYNLHSDWGCMMVKNIVDVRAAFMIGRGVQVVKRTGFTDKAAERELAFVRAFVQANNIDEDAPQKWAVGSELEGKVLLRLRLHPRIPDMIQVVYVPWNKYQYTIVADNPDFNTFIRAKYSGRDTQGGSKNVDVSFDVGPGEFVYDRFGGTADMVNDTTPKAAFVLRHVEDLDKELFDWRRINSLFAAPTPVFTCDSQQLAEDVKDQITNRNWRIGKAIVLYGGRLELVAYKGEGYSTIQKATEADVQVISGATGVPVHFLGHPELLSNRATAENLLELIELSTEKERKTWVGTYEELFQKAIIMYNAAFKQNLNPMAIDAKIPFTSSAGLKLIQDVYLPMYMANTMSLTQLLSYVGEIDVDEEIERIKKEGRNVTPTDGNVAGNVRAGDRRNRR